MNFFAFLNGFRKLTICMIVIVVAVAFRISEHIDGTQLTQVLTVTVPAYFAGNIGEHLTDSVKEYIKKKFEK